MSETNGDDALPEPEQRSDDPWMAFLAARIRLLKAFRADGKTDDEIAKLCSMDGPEHVERILSHPLNR